MGLITGGTCIVHPGTRAPEGPATCLPSKHLLCVILGRRLGPITGGTCIVHPGTSRSKTPCDRATVTVLLREVVPHKAYCAAEISCAAQGILCC